MISQSFDTLRTGKKYRIINHGETYEFVIEKILIDDFYVKDIHTLERYYLNSLLRFGKGNDYRLDELD